MVTRAIVLVGGRGTRLQPLTDTRPKPMLPIVDVPFLSHQLAWLHGHGITDVTFACGFLPQAIVSHFGDGSALGMSLQYVIEPSPLGTGGAIGFAARTGEPGRVVVCNGDVLTDLDLGALIAFHETSHALGTIALTPVDDPSRYGLVRTTDDGRVLEFVEKPEPEQIDTNLINAGTYVLEPEAIARIPETGACSIERDIFPVLAADGVLYALGSDAYWNDIGTHASLVAATSDLLAGRVGGAGVWGGADPVPAGGVFQHATATVDASARIEAPAHLAAGVRVGAGSVIGPNAVLLTGSSVGDECVVRDGAIVLEGATVADGAQVTRAIVGEQATVTAGCIITGMAVVAPGDTVADRAIVRGS